MYDQNLRTVIAWILITILALAVMAAILICRRKFHWNKRRAWGDPKAKERERRRR